MKKKYIIELESGTHLFTFGHEGCIHAGEPDAVIQTVDGMQIGDVVINAKPYTEPDLEQIKADAYNDGYKAGREAEKVRQPDLERIKKTAHDDGYSEGYQAGREDLNRVMSVVPDVEQVRKEAYENGYERALVDVREEHVCQTCVYFERDENEEPCVRCPRNFGDQYMPKQEEIKVGDIVRLKSAPEIEIWVTDVSDEDGGRLSGLALKSVSDNCEIGDTYAYRDIHRFERTGMHYNVATVLEKMRGEQS